MISKTKLLAAALALAVPLATTACRQETETTERWATTEKTNVDIDWNKVNEAYKQAAGPEDLEKRLNEIYEGKEVISVHVTDQDDKVQVVTGFFDHNKDGTVQDDEKIFTIKREPTPEGAQVQTQGYGHYAGYSSPFWTIASSMMMGAMISNMFMPRYVPMAYVTSPSRVDNIRSSRQAYRQSQPGRASQSGRNYGTRPTTRPSGGGRRGGGSFGLKRAGRVTRPQLLTA